MEKEKQKVTREQFIENQSKLSIVFMPLNGKCLACKRDIIDKLIEKGNDGTVLVTYCPLCNRSYDD